MKTETQTKTPKSVRAIEVYSLVDRLGYSDEELKTMLTDWQPVEQWAFVKHDKDDADTHYHIAIRFKNPYPFSQLRNKFPNVADNCFQKVGSWKGLLLYLTHRTRQSEKEKYQYELSEVTASFDYPSWVADNYEEGSFNIDGLLRQISDGSVKLYNLQEHIDVVNYTKYKRKIDDAFRYRGLLMTKTNVERDVIYIQGASGVGKTSLAKLLAESQNMHYFVSSSSNDPFDGYKGEECVILDDARAFLSLSDMLKLLDNNTNSSVKSRYYNKDLSEVKLIILTSTISIDDFFKNVFSDYQESKQQLFRRCKTLIKMDRSNCDTYIYSVKDRSYKFFKREPNEITIFFGICDNAKDEKFVMAMFDALHREIDKRKEEKKQEDYEKAQEEIEKSVKDDDLPF